ncbi:MAG: trifunctional transcriptional activator/DNA repair protein Ada/methylated-DNA--[protein]-cysteine S-methyltransferase [Paracoccaceae bacterium]
MLFELPNHEALYKALLARDERYDGVAFVGVSTTGVFCRLTCPARKPKSENCTFFASVANCIDAGFRPCKRCHPVQPAAQSDPAVSELLSALEKRPDYRWTEADIARMGYDPSAIRKNFKRQFGMTFLQMARQRRLQQSFTVLADNSKVIDAQLSAGFESPSAFRQAFGKLIGRSPSSLKGDTLLKVDWITTPLGDMVAVCSPSHLHILEFVDRKALPTELETLQRVTKCDLSIGNSAPAEQVRAELGAFFAGTNPSFETPLTFNGTPFSKSVWTELQRIPAGTTRTYTEIATNIGRPDATRAVARANGANQIAIIVPCHRVIAADGSLTGYGGGLWRKQKLIEIEQHYKNRHRGDKE